MARRNSTRGAKSGASAWNRARETTANDQPFGEAIPVEPGRYSMQLVGAEVGDFGGDLKLMRKWCVLDNDDFGGLICAEWEGPLDDPDRLVWVQRNLAALGVDLDEVEYEEPKDLEEIYGELIEDCVCASVKVVEKDGYINMRVGKAIEVDEDELVDPKAALSGKAEEAEEKTPKRGAGKKQSKRSTTEEEEEIEEDDDLDVGDWVEFKKGRKKLSGKITEVTDDDEAVIDVDGDEHTVSFDACTRIEAPEEDEPEGEGEPLEWDDLTVGDRVLLDFGEDGEVEAKVTSKPPKTKKKGTVFVHCDDAEDEGEQEEVEVSQVIKILGNEASEGEEDGIEFEEGDEITFKKGRKLIEGTIKSIDDDKAKVKIEGQRKLEVVDIDKLSHVSVD